MGYVASPTDVGTLKVRQVVLRNRLNDGWSRIEQAEQAGADVAAWEELWFSLLREYEACCRDIDAISQPDVPEIAPIAPLQLEGT